MSQITYTQGQLKGWELFAKFYLAPLENVMLLKGYSGTGKSTLVKLLLERLPKLDEMRRLVDPDWKGLTVMVTATTNQAALSLSQATGGVHDTGTIHTALSLRVVNEDYKARGKTKLVAYGKEKVRNALIIIDEASYIDQDLLKLIFSQTENCKILFVGDPAQLTPVGSTYMPAFELTNNQIELTELVRFDGGPISQMVANLRDTVLTNTWHKLPIVPGVIDHVDQATFKSMALEAFKDEKTWGVTKILGFYNDTVIRYNNEMSQHLLGTTELQVGQRVSANGPATQGTARIYNNEEVLIESITPETRYEVEGKAIRLKNKSSVEWFMPNSRAEASAAHRRMALVDDYEAMKEIVDEWVDLRPDYAKTVNKSQGSTYDTVFVDIGDIYRGARTANQLARYLYVGNSRCRSRIVMTGDLG